MAVGSFLAIGQLISGMLDPVRKLVDEVHFSKEEKAQLDAHLKSLEANVMTAMIESENKALEAQAKVAEAQSKIIVAEASNTSWLGKNWRPLSMMIFVGLILYNYVGAGLISTIFNVPLTTTAMPVGLWSVVKLGFTGYVGGRTAEKILPSILTFLSNRKK